MQSLTEPCTALSSTLKCLLWLGINQNLWPCRQYLLDKLEVGKWLFLWVILAEAGSLILAMIMRYMGDLEGRSDPIVFHILFLTKSGKLEYYLQSQSIRNLHRVCETYSLHAFASGIVHEDCAPAFQILSSFDDRSQFAIAGMRVWSKRRLINLDPWRSRAFKGGWAEGMSSMALAGDVAIFANTLVREHATRTSTVNDSAQLCTQAGREDEQEVWPAQPRGLLRGPKMVQHLQQVAKCFRGFNYHPLQQSFQSNRTCYFTLTGILCKMCVQTTPL